MGEEHGYTEDNKSDNWDDLGLSGARKGSRGLVRNISMALSLDMVLSSALLSGLACVQ